MCACVSGHITFVVIWHSVQRRIYNGVCTLTSCLFSDRLARVGLLVSLGKMGSLKCQMKMSEIMKIKCKVRSSHRRVMVLCSVVVLGMLCPIRPLGGVTILHSFDSAGSDSPTFDPGGVLLQDIFASAVAYWEDLIEDPEAMFITYRYRDVDALADGRATFLILGKPSAGVINIDSDPRAWYFDESPLDHAEYDFTQRLFEDLSSSQQSQWFNGNPPDLLEVSYRGTANDSAPAAARTGYDMFSTVVHEIGHVLGLSHQELAGAETFGQGDFDYDVPPQFVNGASFAINTAGTNANDVNDWSHIAAESLMCDNCAQIGLRRLPSATDVFAIASPAGWSQIDFPRVDFLGGTLWNMASNWEGNQIPDLTDKVFVRHGQSVTLGADAAAKQLVIGRGSTLATGASTLSVSESLTVDGTGAAAQTELVVDEGSQVMSNDLHVLDGGAMSFAGGTVDVLSGMKLDGTSGITGNGLLSADSLDNDGTISASNGTLEIHIATNPDLDGSGDIGRLVAVTGSLQITGSLGEPIVFRGQLDIGEGKEFRMDSDGLRNGAPGQINLTGGTFLGPEFQQHGQLTVSGQTSTIDAHSQFFAGSTNILDADLQLVDSAVIEKDANFSGDGSLVVGTGSTIVVNSDANLAVDFVLDGRLEIGSSTSEAAAAVNSYPA